LLGDPRHESGSARSGLRFSVVAAFRREGIGGETPPLR
jgi:hypothetical protein